MNINEFPLEVIAKILSNLSPTEALTTSLACKTWLNAIIQHGNVIIGKQSWKETTKAVDIQKGNKAKIIFTMYCTSLELKAIPEKRLSIGEEIGRGGFRRIYKGIWAGSVVVIKTLLLNSVDETFINQKPRELAIISKINGHPSLLRYYGFSITSKAYSLVTESMPSNLFQKLKNKKEKLPWQRRWQWALDIGSGLSYLHAYRIVHRNLKSTAILLNKRDRAKISNFAFAKQLTGLSEKSEKMIGTPLWMAPELFSPSPEIIPASDVYAYGLVLWEITSRKPPFEDSTNMAQVMTWTQNGQREEIPKDCPKTFADIIQKCWAQDPQDRPTAKEALKMLTSVKPKETTSVLLKNTPVQIEEQK